MQLLLDTHVAIWFITDDPKLLPASRARIASPDNTCYISIASYWEIGIKYALNKLELNAKLEEIFNLIEKSGLAILPISPAHILTNSSLPFHHRDPFDRLIIAQALNEKLVIISKDIEFEKYDVSTVWD